jgi:hypothetical protein
MAGPGHQSDIKSSLMKCGLKSFISIGESVRNSLTGED